MDSNEKECSFNKNGSCLYYYAIEGTLKSVINELDFIKTCIAVNYEDEEMVKDLKGVITKIKNLECNV